MLTLHVHPSEPFKPCDEMRNADGTYRKEYLPCATCDVPSMYEIRKQYGDYAPATPPTLIGHYCGNCLHTYLKTAFPHSNPTIKRHAAYASDCS
jgi:hypothetical protein